MLHIIHNRIPFSPTNTKFEPDMTIRIIRIDKMKHCIIWIVMLNIYLLTLSVVEVLLSNRYIPSGMLYFIYAWHARSYVHVYITIYMRG